MALLFDPLEPVEYIKSDDDYEIESGWCVYDKPSLTSLNKIPINILLSWILSDAQYKSIIYDIELDQLCESLLVDGSIVIAGGKIYHSDHWIVDNKIHAFQIDEDDNIFREYNWYNDQWIVSSYKDDQFSKLINEIKINTDQLYLYPNGEGIIKPIQLTYKRLEEIEVSRRQQTTEAALSLIILGYEGPDKRRVEQSFKNGAKILFIESPEAKIERVASSQIIGYLSDNFTQLLPLYFKALNVPLVDDSSNLSGISKQISLQPTVRYCQQIRNKLINIINELGGSIEFKPIITLSIDERQKELDLLVSKRDLGILSDEEFRSLARKV